jgi:hypothetical protein
LLRTVQLRRTPTFDSDNKISEPFGCSGFFCVRGLVPPLDLLNLTYIVGESAGRSKAASRLTPNLRDKSFKVFCYSAEQRKLRGQRYAAILRSRTNHPLVRYELANGTDLNTMVASLFSSADPFVTETKLLCQQIGWHFEDLDAHCDLERRDKTAVRDLLPGSA